MRVLLFANTDWYLYNFRRSLALALREAGHDVVLVSPPGEFGLRLRALGLRWIAAPMERRSLNPWRELRFLAWLTRLLVEEHVDLVHSFTIKCAVYGSAAARLAGVRARVNAVAGMGYVFTNEAFAARLLRPIVRGLMRLTLGGRGARLILQNPDDVEYFAASRMVEASSIRLIPGSGVDCGKFSPGDDRGDGRQGGVRVVLPARILWDKGVGEFVQAARILRASGRHLQFLLAGAPDPGNPASVPKEQIDGWCREGLLDWLGHVEDMPSLYRSADIVALPSYREGLPKGLIEAAACRVCLVTTDVPGCRDVVKDGVDGLLVPPRDADALAGAIALLYDDAELRERLAASARARAFREFDERIVIARTMEVYDELLAPPVALPAG